MPRHAAKKDTTHAEIAAEFERLGCTVLDTSAYSGFVDMLVFRHHPRLVEAKTGRRKLRQSQVKLAKLWPGPIHVVRSAIEARALVCEWDREHVAINLGEGWSVRVTMVDGNPYITAQHVAGSRYAANSTVARVTESGVEFLDWHPTDHVIMK